MTVEELKQSIEEKKAEMLQLTEQSETELENGNTELSKELLEKAKALKTEIEELESQLENNEEDSSEVETHSEDTEAVEEDTEEDKQDSDVSEEIKTELKQIKNMLGDKRNMTQVVETVAVNNKEVELRDAFGAYIKTGVVNNELREGNLVSGSNAVIVPTEVAKEVSDYSNDVTALANLVQVRKVNTPSGEIAYFDGDSAKSLKSTAELEKNPSAAVQALKKAIYKVDTYRGQLPISKEMIEDGIGAVELVSELLRESKIATENSEILKVLKTKEAKEVTKLDDIKALLNKELAVKHKKGFVVSQSVFNWLDSLKDANERYLLQDNVQAQSGKQLFGLPVTIVEDTLIGANTAYVGDLKASVCLADRSQYEARWTQNDIYGEVLMIATRFDVVELNKKATIKFTVTGIEASDSDVIL